jgi:integrase
MGEKLVIKKGARMAETFERVAEHLYRRRYQTAAGEWHEVYYARFTDWRGIRRKFPLGGDVKDAQDKLGELRTLNKGRYDWDAEKRKVEDQRRRAVIFSQWGNRYFKDKLNPNANMRESSSDREERSFKHLEKFFGDLPLVEIKKGRILDYRKKRAVDGVEFSTVNRELRFLGKLLNVAADQDTPILEAVPRFKLPSEASRARTRTVNEDEYAAILARLRRPQQRYVIALYETAMRRDEPMKLTWDKVDLKMGLIRLMAEDVKEDYPRRTPISWELRQVLEELKAEQKRIGNITQHVFTRKNGQPIKSIRKAFELAREKAKLEGVVLHDLRRTAITRWTDLGIPRDMVMAASGHKPSGVHDRYLNFTDKQLISAFRVIIGPVSGPQREVESRSNVSY